MSRKMPVMLFRLAVVAATVLLAWLAASAGLGSAHLGQWVVALDVAVGIAFVGTALVAPGPAQMRALVGLVGVAWLAGSVLPVLQLVHQGVLAIALVAFPTGRPRFPEVWVTAVIAAAVAVLLVPQGLVAILFGGIAVRSLVRRTQVPVAYPFASASAVALVLGGVWLARAVAPSAYDPVVGLVTYAVVLLMVAAAFPFAMRSIADRTTLRERVLAGEALTGLEGLALALAETLRDPSIRVHAWDPVRKRYVGADGEVVSGDPAREWLPIVDDGEPMGAIEHRSAALGDERTASAVTDALRLALQNLRWQRALAEQLVELEAARTRLVQAADGERAAVAERLRGEVMVSVTEAAATLRETAKGSSSGDGADALTVALVELDGAADDLMHLVQGMGPIGMGQGGLVRTLRDLASRSSLDIEVMAEPDAVGDAAGESALYFACVEAVANASKHASANHVRITVRRLGEALQAVVGDDGVGGADAQGSGLQGLADRLAASGGRLRVESPPGAGTTVIADVPVSRSSAIPPV